MCKGICRDVKLIFSKSAQRLGQTPIYKKGSNLEPKNYRPISPLPVISKIFEKIIHNQMQS